MLSRGRSKGEIDPVKYKQDLQLLQHLGMFVQLADEGIAAFDLKGILHFVNIAWAKMHGYETGKELLGKKIDLFHTKEKVKTVVKAFMDNARRKGSVTGILEHVRKDGTTFPARMKMSVLKDERGKANGLVVIISDNTEHKQVEDAESVPDGQENSLKEQFEQLQRKIGEHETAEEDLKKQIEELKSSKEQLQLQLSERDKAGAGQEQQATELTTANERLQEQISKHEIAEGHFKEQIGELKAAKEQLQRQVGEREKADDGQKMQAAELRTANEQLQEQIKEHKQAEEGLKQQVSELQSANEQLQRQVDELEKADEGQKQQVADLTAANEKLQEQIKEHKQAEESLKQEFGELQSTNEQLQRQVGENEKADEGQKQQVAELKSVNEQLQKQIIEDKQARTDLMKHLNAITETIIDMQNKASKSSGGRKRAVAGTDDAEESGESSPPLDVERLKSIADLAKRLRQ